MADKATLDLVGSLGGVVLGWLLGVGTTAIDERRKRKTRVRAMKAALSLELRETAQRMLAAVYKLEGRFGRLDRTLLEWMLPEIERYEGPNPKDGMLAGVRGFLGSSDDVLAKVSAHLQATTPPQVLPREEVSYAAASLIDLRDCEPDYARRVLDILAHVRMFNEASEDNRYYLRLTFTPGLTEENGRKCMENVDGAEALAARRARIIVDKITDLERRYPSNA